MNLDFQELSIRNFMSFGNVTEDISLDKDNLTLVLGENLDKGEDSGERNGVGKSSIIMAIHFALFGQAIGNKIKKSNLINKTNQKNCEVTLKFKKGSNTYTIKRFRKPEKLEFYVDDDLVNEQGGDEGQGEMKDTQEEINRVLSISGDMINQTVLLSTYVDAFLSQGAGKQRELIEELLGITLLSEKATQLKEMLKETKTQLDKEDFKISTLQETNTRVLKNHDKTMLDLRSREEKWKKESTQAILDLEEAVESLSHINVEDEIKNHEYLSEWKAKKKKQDEVIANLERTNVDKGRHERTIQQAEKRLVDLTDDHSAAKENKCPTCHQDVHDENHQKVLTGIIEKIDFYQKQIDDETDDLGKVLDRLLELEKIELDAGKKPSVFYDEINEAYQHRSNLQSFLDSLEAKKKEANPYSEQISSQPEAPLQTISYELRDDLMQLKDHQEFLLKLLTSKDSIVRKRIINQNISYLNARLSLYLEKLGLPHEVEFQNDLSTEITMLGNDFDFASLSRGERARLTLGLTFAFRDVWESLNHQINLLFIDEVLDNGIDSAGIEMALKTLKQMARERGKKIFIVSHREELITRCSNVLSVIKEGGFSRIEYQKDQEIA